MRKAFPRKIGGISMIKSMTGYGRAREVRNKRDITVEVRSVNNRYLDCTVKMPRMYSFAEDAVKQCVQKAISRGKVDCSSRWMPPPQMWPRSR